jgi:four helix bundle protein
MHENNPLLVKSFDFGVKASSIAYDVRAKYKEFDLSSQLTRSSTSIGANAEESIGAESVKDFYHKLSIAYKEARESRYFIRVLAARKMIDKQISKELLSEVEELMKIIGAIKRTLKKKYKLGRK